MKCKIHTHTHTHTHAHTHRGRGSLEGYSPQGCKDLYITKNNSNRYTHMHTHTHTHTLLGTESHMANIKIL